jgi:hypothetical protein
MISIRIQNSTDRKTIVVDETTTTPKEAFAQAEINYNGAIIQLDGCTLTAGEMGMTFEELNIASECYLIATVKTTNAY